MKKLLSILLVLMLTAAFLAGASAQSVSSSAAPSTALDIVLLIDQSNSMTEGDTNDPDGYRLDAAEMIVAMCNMDGSRVAVLPFDQKTGSDSFTDINTVSRRTAKIADINEFKGKTTGGTDYGEALYKAYQLLAERKDPKNQPMIILLTDGENKPNGTSKVYWAYDAASGEFTQTKSKVVTTADADSLVNIMQDILSDAGIPVYTVALYNAKRARNSTDKANEIKTYAGRLLELAERTNGQFYPIETSGTSLSSVDSLRNSFLASEEYAPLSLEELPLAFGSMFADRIGSSQPQGLYPVSAGGGKYTVSIPILNASVSEANIFVLKKGLKESSIRLVDGDGKAVGVQPFSSDNFVLYKLSKPLPAGIWKLEFELADNADVNEILNNITFNLLYSYDTLELRTSSRVNANQTVEGETALTASKKDAVALEAYFYDLSKAQRSEDYNLYHPVSAEEDWYVIRGTWALERLNSEGGAEVVTSGGMTTGDFNFTAALALNQIALDAGGYNRLRAGEYRIHITVAGAGISREQIIPLTLTNTAPAMSSNASATISVDVDKADVPGSEAPMTYSLDLYSIFQDEDHDALTFSMADDVTDDALELRLEGSTLTYRTVKGADQMRDGVVEAQITVSDGDNGGTLQQTLTFNVISGLNSFVSSYDMTVSCTDSTGSAYQDGVALAKNQPYTFTVTPVARNVQDALAVDWQNNVRVELSGWDNATIPMAWNGSGYTCQINPEHSFADKKLTFYVSYNGQTVNAPAWTLNVSNNAPGNTMLTDEQKNLTLRHNALPDFAAFLEQPSDNEELYLDLSAYFTDADGDPLTYSLSLQGANDANLLQYEDLGGGVFRLTPRDGAHGSVVLQVKATDNDGESSGVLKLSCKVVNLVRKWVTLASIVIPAFIGLIILICIICHLAKPKFPIPYTLHAREGMSAYDFDSYDLSPSRKAITLASVIMEDNARNAGVSPTVLTAVTLQPVRGSHGSIGVSCNPKQTDGVSVTLENQPVGKKLMIWSPGQSLELRAGADASSFIRVILASSEEMITPGSGMSDPFGQQGGFGFSSSADSFGAPAGQDGGFSAPPANSGSGSGFSDNTPDF
ncbi:MAG: VWA domain-containing protein [Eubacteriales bacterium]|nr:VWA domain-containing protein [Eubacteriales bacterium]